MPFVSQTHHDELLNSFWVVSFVALFEQLTALEAHSHIKGTPPLQQQIHSVAELGLNNGDYVVLHMLYLRL